MLDEASRLEDTQHPTHHAQVCGLPLSGNDARPGGALQQYSPGRQCVAATSPVQFSWVNMAAPLRANREYIYIYIYTSIYTKRANTAKSRPRPMSKQNQKHGHTSCLCFAILQFGRRVAHGMCLCGHVKISTN